MDLQPLQRSVLLLAAQRQTRRSVQNPFGRSLFFDPFMCIPSGFSLLFLPFVMPHAASIACAHGRSMTACDLGHDPPSRAFSGAANALARSG